MAEEETEQVTWVDADGNVTDDPDRAVRGEILQVLPDGTTEATTFVVDGSAPEGGDRP